MKKEILNRLQQLEIDFEIKVLFACESGSRAWGFPSPDSDYDVRIIYSKPFNKYLSIYPIKETIETPLKNNFDIAGWDIKKTLLLINKSNAVVWEWLNSPTIYNEQTDFREQIYDLSNGYFSPKSCFHHYLSISNSSAKKIEINSENKNEYNLKKLFYCLRSILAARWILEFNSIPPMNIIKLLNADYISSDIKSKIEDLIQEKLNKKESEGYPVDRSLIKFIINSLQLCQDNESNIPHIKKSEKTGVNELDSFLKKIILPEHL